MEKSLELIPLHKSGWKNPKAAENGKKGGRPKGKKERLTILKEKVLIDAETSIVKMAQKLTNAQAIVALGTHKMLAVYFENGERKTEIVRDDKKIQKLLDDGEYGKDYLIIEGSKADWKAANALLDRTFGKATETIKHSGEVTFSLRSILKSAADGPIEIGNQDITDDDD